MIKKLFGVFFYGCVVFGLFNVQTKAFTNSLTSLSQISDTTKLFKDEYLNLINENNTSLSKSTISDDQTVQISVEAFLAMAKASVRKPDKYNPSKVILSSELQENTIKYRLSDYVYQAKLNMALNQVISDDKLEFTDFKVKYDGNNATASIVESYTYYYL